MSLFGLRLRAILQWRRGLGDLDTGIGFGGGRRRLAADGVTVSWADGEWGVKEVQLPINNDAEEEGSEEFTVKLTNATAGAIGARSTALIRIDDDDSPSEQQPPPEEPPPVNPGTSGGGGQIEWLSMMLMLYLVVVRRRVCWQYHRSRNGSSRVVEESTVQKKTMCICWLAFVVFGSSMAAAVRAAPTRWEPAAGGNGHLYEAVTAGSPVSWDTARAAARARGPGWDLATITSAEESAFVKSLFATRPKYIQGLHALSGT